MQKLVYGVGALVALLIMIGFALPSSNRVEVSIEIDAYPATVFALVNDFRRFSLWSPWSDTDPNARIIYSGANRGVGASMTWDGAIIGSGTQIIVASQPYEHVQIVMSRGEPAESQSWFNLVPGTGTTIVTWGFKTDYGLNIVARYFSPMLGSIVARDYHNGLVQLKRLAESLPAADFSDLEIEHIFVEATDIAFLTTQSRPEAAAISAAMAKAYFQILNFIDKHDLEEAGAPLSIARDFNGSQLVFDAAIPVRGANVDTPRGGVGVRLGSTYAGSVIRVRHVGSYRRLTATHQKISAYLMALGIERNGAVWESYVSDPRQVAEDDLLTYVYYPIKPI